MPDAAKAAHYLHLLDDARCEGNWDDVPELVRKVRKHAPNRSCLALTAETETAITKVSLKVAAAASSLDRPSTAESALGLEVASRIPNLLVAIESERQFPEEGFQAKVSIGWVHWVLKEYSLALERLPGNFDQEYPLYENLDALSEWTKVCALKSSYLRANCMARNGQRDGAMEIFASALPSLSAVWATKPARQQLRYWAELFLTEYCMLASQAIRENDQSLSDPNCLACFRAWSNYWAGTKGTPLPGGYGFKGSVPRRQVWSEYYFAVSEILQRDLPFPTGYAPASNESSARHQLRTELKKVETVYQALLYNETRFPRADEERAEVEDFVDRVMQNWIILNGRAWREQDLGAGGRDSLCHGVLDTLYHAATKTYHSTAILRHLFTVHLAVAEFDLAFMSFDSYFELVKKGKARVDKTGHPEPALDDDATLLETISACIAALCRYGGKQAAEKARDLALELEDSLERGGHLGLGVEDGFKPLQEDRPLSATPRSEVPPNILALAWQSVGLAHAQWARVTYDSESRTQTQEKAILCLRKSLSPEFVNAADIKGVFALGLLYAEQRKLTIGIELVKTALLAGKAAEENQELYNGPYWRERSLIPLWHLLALMLSARQEYVMAARACEGAIEQFKDPQLLFGGQSVNGQYRSDHLNEVGVKDEKSGGHGIVDEMDDYEKEGVLEIKMTQLAILELMEGPAVAVNASSELLTLFPRLFGDVEQKVDAALKVEPPKSSAGTLRSIRGSVFGSRSEKTSRSRQTVLNNEKMATIPSRPATSQTVQSVATTMAPTIQVTNEHGDPRSSRRSRKSDSINRRSESNRRASLRKRERSESRGGAPHQPSVVDGEKFFTPFDDLHLQQYFNPKTVAKQDVPGLRHSESYTSNTSSRSKNAELSGISVDEVESFATLLPFVQFPPDHNKRRRRAILVKVWLEIAGYYRRAGLFDDAQKACAEAQKIVQTLEGEVSSDNSGLLSLRSAGWGQRKTVEQLLGDVWTERGQLSLARERPYQARADFETALTHFPDHGPAIVGLSNILMDVYSEKLILPPAVPGIDLVKTSDGDVTQIDSKSSLVVRNKPEKFPVLPSEPLGLVVAKTRKPEVRVVNGSGDGHGHGHGHGPGYDHGLPLASPLLGPDLPPPHKATSLPLIDRLAARDRAYVLLSGLTKLGSGWNYSEAWFTLARAYEESDQVDKAKDALWWCVELEDGMGAREWSCVGAGGYVL
ncbi:hypothetical protein B0T22DRAFT_419911 [Podospora appendiculata]|uniref:Filamentation protein n=1 Tax=Podospora appendiculata TaxID=314037 RepID=A0AAE0XGR4_9PEZI|nr:hypothetical protein B0T22DRAFT_419911 [Podospora appendiculata]